MFAQLHFNICKETWVQLEKKHWYEHVPKSTEKSQGGKVTILWNQQAQTDRTIPNNKPDIIILTVLLSQLLGVTKGNIFYEVYLVFLYPRRKLTSHILPVHLLKFSPVPNVVPLKSMRNSPIISYLIMNSFSSMC